MQNKEDRDRIAGLKLALVSNRVTREQADQYAPKLVNISSRLYRLGYTLCERDLTDREETEKIRLRVRFEEILETLKCGKPARFSQDPRGYACGIIFPNGENNGWGGQVDGYRF